MSDNTGIEWAQATWNPIVGCSKCSPGCDHCYAERMGKRLKAMGTEGYDGVIEDGKWNGSTSYIRSALTLPMKWKKPRRIFVCSMGDLFHESVPFEWIDRVFAVMALCHQHTFMLLTKRAKVMHDYLSLRHGYPGRWFDAYISGGGLIGADEIRRRNIQFPLPNVWIGATVENQAADERIPWLLKTPAALRFVSVEPMLGLLNVSPYLGKNILPSIHGLTNDVMDGIDWVICGGESGPGARPIHPIWVRLLRNQCINMGGVPFLFKQWGEWKEVYDRDHEDPSWKNCPEPKNQSERYVNLEGGHGFHGERVVFMKRVGKKKAGRLLDGRTWEEFPERK